MIKFFISAAFYLIFNFTAEIYNTMQRGTAISFENFICRMSGMSMPYLASALLKEGQFAIFWPFMIISAISAFGTIILPKDTVKASLDTYFNDDN